MTLLARSKGKNYGQQTYVSHVSGALTFLKQFANETLKYAARLAEDALGQILYLTVLFHDLGKLDELNQKALSSSGKKKLPVFHEDAGAAYFHDMYFPCTILIYSHHKGLPDFSVEIVKKEKGFRFEDTDLKLGFSRTQEYLRQYVNDHLTEFKRIESDISALNAPLSSLDWRILLSLVADSDHSDAAKHCWRYFHQGLPEDARWAERLAKLDLEISKKGMEASNKFEVSRNRLRSRMYKCCRNSPIAHNLIKCEAPVGSGKTASVLSYLLKRAADAEVMPSRLFVVVPFTNLICQIVDDLRDWIVLDGEDPEEIVAAHYHTAEYSSEEAKHLSVLWRARVIVTTSVQFFETMASNKTVSLRKLHALPGSLVFIDEFHSCLPLNLWPVAWPWLKALANDWNCKIALSSGSIAEVWKLVASEGEIVPSILETDLSDQLLRLEQKRIGYEWIDTPLSLDGLKGVVLDRGDWPKLVIMNTVQNAAEVALFFREDGLDVIHLSTSMTPLHRRSVVKTIKNRLKNKIDSDWILVATSCVEAGMDFSFKTGFREAFSVSSTLQPAGRVNRNFSSPGAVLYVFTTVEGDGFNKHPSAEPDIVARCFDENWFDTKAPSELVQSALEAEWNGKTNKPGTKKLKDDDHACNFKTVRESFKVIANETQTVLVSDKLHQRIENYEKVNWRDVQLNSVQLWGDKIEKLGIAEIRDTGVYYIHENKYDYELVGIMKMIRELNRFNQQGGDCFLMV